MSFREIWNGPSFLNRSEVAQRMTMRDNAGKVSKKSKKKKKHYEEHFNKDWDADLWDQTLQHCLSGSMGYRLS